MGIWTDPVDTEDIVESTAGAGAASTPVYPTAGEGYHYEIERTDSPTEPWTVALELSLDGTDFGQDPPARCYRLQAAQTWIEIPVRGPIYCCRIWIENDDATPVDEVAATVRFRKDQVSL